MDSARTSNLEKIAIENDFWVKNTGPWEDEDGKIIPNRWERCEASDPEAQPDLNSAAMLDHYKDT